MSFHLVETPSDILNDAQNEQRLTILSSNYRSPVPSRYKEKLMRDGTFQH